MQRTLDASKIKSIDIAGNTIFKIKISTKPQKDISINLQVEGENNEQIVLQTKQKHDTLFISSAYQPMFIKPDDKLAAHKQISLELILQIPEDLNLLVRSDIASVFITGLYNQVVAELLNGHFFASKFSGNLQVDTLHGNITVETRAGKFNINSKKGKVQKANLPIGTNQFLLNSINGNISVFKTE